MNPYRLRPRLRWATYVLALAGAGYLLARFDSFRLSASGCSPLLRFAPGEALLLDRWPRTFDPGDALLYRAPDGLIYLGLVERVRAESGSALWVVADDPHCNGRGSEDFGWIELDDCVARVVLKWPW